MTHSFPSRRSSELDQLPAGRVRRTHCAHRTVAARPWRRPAADGRLRPAAVLADQRRQRGREPPPACHAGRLGHGRFFLCHGSTRMNTDQELLSFMFTRAEEHTSELQSLMRISYAVFCLKQKTTETPNQ